MNITTRRRLTIRIRTLPGAELFTRARSLHLISRPLPGEGALLAKSSQAILSKKGMTIKANTIGKMIKCRYFVFLIFISPKAPLMSSPAPWR